jgi:hypothetical protein
MIGLAETHALAGPVGWIVVAILGVLWFMWLFRDRTPPRDDRHVWVEVTHQELLPEQPPPPAKPLTRQQAIAQAEREYLEDGWAHSDEFERRVDEILDIDSRR